MALTEQDVEAYKCPVCGSLARHENVPCCGESREPVDDVVLYDQPEIEAVIKTVFDLSSTDLAICRVLMAQDEATAKDLAAELSLDRTTINRRLNHLVDLGVVEKQPQILKQGGQINVYSNVPLDEVHRRLQLGLYRWLADAEEVLDELHQEKLKLLVQEAEVEPTEDPDLRVDRNQGITGEDEATDEPDARADGDGNDPRVVSTDGEFTDDSDSPADEDGDDSLIDRLLGRYRS